MSLVVGILGDDAIVEIENIIRHLRMGKTRMKQQWKLPMKLV